MFIDPELGYYWRGDDWLEYITAARNFFHICFNTSEKSYYFINEAFKMLDDKKMVLVGEANYLFNKRFGATFTKNLMANKPIFAYNKDGELMYVTN
jgi:hypothetical protein